MQILGLSPFKHDPAAALVADGTLESAIEERKLVRFPCRGLPHAAIDYCFKNAGIGWKNVDYVASSGRPLRAWVRKSLFNMRRALVAPAAGAYFQAKETGVLSRELNHSRYLRELCGASPSGPKRLTFDHHFCHAATAFYSSPFDRAVIVVLDEEGDACSGLVAIGAGAQIRVVQKIPFPHSLAWVYSQVTALLGFVPHREEHKVQWLGLDAEPSFENVFLDMLGRRRNSVPSLDFSYFTAGLAGPIAFSPKFYSKVGLCPQNGHQITAEQQKTLASSLQHACAKIVSDLVVDYCKREKIENVCLGGGLFENTLLVADCERNLPYRIFVPPAPGNAGSALGAASLVWHQLLGNRRSQFIPNVYCGPKYTRQDIKEVLDNCKARYACHYTERDKLDVAVRLLGAGKILGWYQGAAEFGSRALGNRSLLASPWSDYVKENLNDYVKHREWFRPFALAVPEDDCSRFFDCSHLPRFMSSLAQAHATSDERLRGFFLAGNRVRLHVVHREVNPLFWRLLKRFGESAPAPILVNTSFNLFGEPLVVSPRDAVRSFYCSGIDALMIDYFLLTKHNDLGISPAVHNDVRPTILEERCDEESDERRTTA